MAKDMSKKKVVDKLIGALDWFLLLLIGATYIAQGFFYFKRNDKSIFAIVGEGALAFALGLIFYVVLRSRGLRYGRKAEQFIASSELYAIAKEETKPFRNKTGAYCLFRSEQEFETSKRECIENAGLNYENWKKGIYTPELIEKMHLSDEQRRALIDVSKIKYEYIEPRQLYSDLPQMSERKRKKYGRYGMGDKDYALSNNFRDGILMVFWAILFGGFALDKFENFSVATVLWHCLQVVMWVGFGLYKFFQAYSFMINEYRQTHIIQKTEILNDFISLYKNNPKILDKYDYELQALKELEKGEEDNVNDSGKIQRDTESVSESSK